MFEAFIYNISVIVAGIYLFHRLQYSENKRMVFSKAYVTVLMTIVSLLLSVYPIPYREDYLIHLTFVPLLFLGRFTNMVYTLSATVIVAIVEIVVFNNSIMYGVTLIVIAAVTSAIGPFLKQNDVLSLLILNVVTIITLASAITFVDIWHFFSLVNRYENEDKYDYLTGLGNVKEFDRHLNEISRKAEKEHQSIALLLIDIDGFKDVNDTYSHKSGDAVLKQMSQLLKNYVPNQFKIFRNGGEEFSVVIHNYSLDQSVKLAENIRSGVEKSSFHLPNKEVIKLSVSIGVGYLTDDDPKSQRKVFKDADDMVHVAKNQGRNKVMFNPIINL
ncbi:TPA: GGDEF domain-containing protein [Staphylococcus aureus]